MSTTSIKSRLALRWTPTALVPLALSLSFIGCSSEPAPPPLNSGSTARVLSGEQLYLNCRACHGPDGKGIQGMAPTLANSPYLGNDQHIIAILRNGYDSERSYSGIMQGFESRLSDQEIATLVSWMRQRWTPASPDLRAATVSQERQKPLLRRALKPQDLR